MRSWLCAQETLHILQVSTGCARRRPPRIGERQRSAGTEGEPAADGQHPGDGHQWSAHIHRYLRVDTRRNMSRPSK